MGFLVFHFGAFIAGMIISFIRGWKLTLVMCSILPVVVGSGMISSSVSFILYLYYIDTTPFMDICISWPGHLTEPVRARLAGPDQ